MNNEKLRLLVATHMGPLPTLVIQDAMGMLRSLAADHGAEVTRLKAANTEMARRNGNLQERLSAADALLRECQDQPLAHAVWCAVKDHLAPSPASEASERKANWVNEVLDHATRVVEAWPEWMKRPEFRAPYLASEPPTCEDCNGRGTEASNHVLGGGLECGSCEGTGVRACFVEGCDNPAVDGLIRCEEHRGKKGLVFKGPSQPAPDVTAQLAGLEVAIHRESLARHIDVERLESLIAAMAPKEEPRCERHNRPTCELCKPVPEPPLVTHAFNQNGHTDGLCRVTAERLSPVSVLACGLPESRHVRRSK